MVFSGSPLGVESGIGPISCGRFEEVFLLQSLSSYPRYWKLEWSTIIPGRGDTNHHWCLREGKDVLNCVAGEFTGTSGCSLEPEDRGGSSLFRHGKEGGGTTTISFGVLCLPDLFYVSEYCIVLLKVQRYFFSKQ